MKGKALKSSVGRWATVVRFFVQRTKTYDSAVVHGFLERGFFYGIAENTGDFSRADESASVLA